jgi:hypothetical protein
MKAIVAGTVALVAVALSAAQAQDKPTSQQNDAAPEVASEPYRPAISDIMALQQRRHIKLWFAGTAGNWPLADYEVDALKGGFGELDSQLEGGTVKDAVGAAIAALEQAVETKDRTAFLTAYDQLSAGCNSCHHTLDHAFIVIRRPSTLPYSDQSFAVQKK